jgi:Ca-activated chloride channel family protein
LSRIYEEIGELEKTKIETREYVDYTELAQGLVIPAFLLLLLEALLAHWVLRRLP